MCWSAPVSLALGTAGAATALYAHRKGETSDFTLPLAYFSAMEFLQFFSYFYIGECAVDSNTWLTTASYVHIAFQPLFMNIFFMYWLPGHLKKRIRHYVYAACLILASLTLIKLIPFTPSALCEPGQTLCGPVMCTVPGTWHLAWSVPYYNWPVPFDAIVYYMIGTFFIPLLYGAWRSVVTTIVTGPLVAYYLSSGNPQEWPAVWCFYSIILIIGGLVSHVYMWKRPARLYREFFRHGG